MVTIGCDPVRSRLRRLDGEAHKVFSMLRTRQFHAFLSSQGDNVVNAALSHTVKSLSQKRTSQDPSSEAGEPLGQELE